MKKRLYPRYSALLACFSWAWYVSRFDLSSDWLSISFLLTATFALVACIFCSTASYFASFWQWRNSLSIQDICPIMLHQFCAFAEAPKCIHSLRDVICSCHQSVSKCLRCWHIAKQKQLSHMFLYILHARLDLVALQRIKMYKNNNKVSSLKNYFSRNSDLEFLQAQTWL